MKKIILALIVFSSVGTTPLTSLAGTDRFLTSTPKFSLERQTQQPVDIEEVKDRFRDEVAASESSDKLGNFEIQDLMSTFNDQPVDCRACRRKSTAPRRF